jgi:4-amino-4-deoxy-L-arabinose transferase-like glycosyltransferase
LALVLALGIAIRVVYTVLVAPWPPSGFDDQTFYHLEPTLLAHGRGFIEPVFARIGRTVPTAEHAPLYPLVLAGLAKLGGTGADVQRLAGTVFGAGTIAAVGLLGRRLGGDRAGLLAAGLAAVYPILITADGALMSESLYGCLVGASLVLAYRLLDAPSLKRAALLGAVVGLAALTRGEAVVLLVLLLIPLLRRPRGIRLAAATCAAVILVLTPWTVRNWSVFGRFVPISTDTGAVIGGANCDGTYYGSNIGGWSYICNHASPGNEAQQSSRDMSVGLHYASHHLHRLPMVVVARLERVWSLRQPMQTNSGRSAWAQDAGTIMYYLLLVPAAYGFLLLRRRKAPTWVLMAPVVLVTLTAVLGYGFLRFREPAEITLVVLAGITLDHFLHRRTVAAGTQIV